jgi:hypothetical protein
MFCSATSTVLAADVNWDWTGVRSIFAGLATEKRKGEGRGRFRDRKVRASLSLGRLAAARFCGDDRATCQSRRDGRSMQAARGRDDRPRALPGLRETTFYDCLVSSLGPGRGVSAVM